MRNDSVYDNHESNNNNPVNNNNDNIRNYSYVEGGTIRSPSDSSPPESHEESSLQQLAELTRLTDQLAKFAWDVTTSPPSSPATSHVDLTTASLHHHHRHHQQLQQYHRHQQQMLHHQSSTTTIVGDHPPSPHLRGIPSPLTHRRVESPLSISRLSTPHQSPVKVRNTDPHAASTPLAAFAAAASASPSASGESERPPIPPKMSLTRKHRQPSTYDNVPNPPSQLQLQQHQLQAFSDSRQASPLQTPTGNNVLVVETLVDSFSSTTTTSTTSCVVETIGDQSLNNILPPPPSFSSSSSATTPTSISALPAGAVSPGVGSRSSNADESLAQLLSAAGADPAVAGKFLVTQLHHQGADGRTSVYSSSSNFSFDSGHTSESGVNLSDNGSASAQSFTSLLQLSEKVEGVNAVIAQVRKEE